MPYGIQFTDEIRYDDKNYINLSISSPNTFLFSKFRRKTRHLIKYGTLENFPTERRGVGTFWKETSTTNKLLIVGLGILIGYLLFKK